MQWVANQLSKTEVIYNSKVVSVSPEISEEGKVRAWQVQTENGQQYLAKRLIFGAGRDLNIPAVFADIEKGKVIHSFSLSYLSGQPEQNRHQKHLRGGRCSEQR